MPFLNNENKPSFLGGNSSPLNREPLPSSHPKPGSVVPHIGEKTSPAKPKDSFLKNLVHGPELPKKAEVKTNPKPEFPKERDPFTEERMQKKEIAKLLEKDPEIRHLASMEKKDPREFAKELLERFKHSNYSMDIHEVKQQLLYKDPWEIRQEALKDHGDPAKFDHEKHNRQENEILKEKFKVK